jgi:hypothetical protein
MQLFTAAVGEVDGALIISSGLLVIGTRLGWMGRRRSGLPA